MKIFKLDSTMNKYTLSNITFIRNIVKEKERDLNIRIKKFPTLNLKYWNINIIKKKESKLEMCLRVYLSIVHSLLSFV